MDGLIIWAFSTSGIAHAWQVDNGERPRTVAKRGVDTSGIVHDIEPYKVNGWDAQTIAC